MATSDLNGKKNGASHSRTAPSSVPPTFCVPMSLSFFLGSILFVSSVAFAVGYWGRVYILPAPEITTVKVEPTPPSHIVRSESLPPPFLADCKILPDFVYTSKHFETGIRSSSDNMLVRHKPQENEASENQKACPVLEKGLEDDHQPAGQHLLVDIKNVDGSFLNSEFRLASAMVDLINLSGLTMLSYHCHGLEPIGVSCVGVLLESHVSFHTWPIEGVITFDLFTCGPKSLLPLLDTIKGLFGVPRRASALGPSVEEPHMNWSYKKRGFDRSGAIRNPEEATDMNMFLLGWMEYDIKQLVAEVETDYQTVEIYDLMNPRFRRLDSYRRSLSKDDSYEAAHPELFRPDRIVYLDHIMQSRYYGEAAYHEALVHPALFAHRDPKRVAIIGGGEGATLREILKHNTVETVTMIEIDQKMVEASREFLPEWSDCSNLVGSADSCFDDPRTETFFTDAIAWFIDNYGEGSTREKYDIIILDALDPSSAVAFSDVLYDNTVFLDALSRSTSEEAIIVSQTGEDDFMDSNEDQFSEKFTQHLKRNGFEKVKTYSEAHGGFLGVWSFFIAFKHRSTLADWYANQAEVDFKVAFRSMKTKDDSDTPFRYFDGATMMGYQFANRISQEVFCRQSPPPPYCENQHGFDPETINIPMSKFEVKTSNIPNAGRGLFSKGFIPKGAFLAAEELVHAILAPPSTTDYLQWLEKKTDHDFINTLAVYLFGYGYGHDFYGMPGYSVEPSLLTFMNHGCNGTFNTGLSTSVTEMTASLEEMPDELAYNEFESSIDNSFACRNHLNYLHGFAKSLRDIEAGEEIMDNYLSFHTDESWEEGILKLRAQCISQDVGEISQYEREKESSKPNEEKSDSE